MRAMVLEAPGHQIVGLVETVGREASGFSPGDRVGPAGAAELSVERTCPVETEPCQ